VHADHNTRQRLLHAATRLFAERGFKKVTVREICKPAKANVAAVNYHFRDKLGLYREVLQLAIAAMRETTPSATTPGGGSAEDRLRASIRGYLRRMLSSGADRWLFRLINRELADPAPEAVDAIVEHVIRPRVRYLCALVSEILDCSPADKRVLRSVASIQAQCVMSRPHPIGDRLRKRRRWTPGDIDALARHIADFSLAGIRAVGQQPAGRSSPRRH
jgi:TetR/AcrR family transcriptional regulator, regulator of cefoperazone and chloramphenicol sensitivity